MKGVAALGRGGGLVVLTSEVAQTDGARLPAVAGPDGGALSLIVESPRRLGEPPQEATAVTGGA